MLKTLRVMLVANKNQNTRLFQFAGTARFAYNWALEQEKKNYEAGGKFINDYELRKRFTVFKQEADNRWLYTVSNNVCKQAVKDAADAYKKFFKGLAEHPKYKSRKRSKPSFYVDPIKIKFTETHVKLENIVLSKKKNRKTANWFRLAEHERIPIDSKYFNPRVSFDGLNWFLTVGIEIEEPASITSGNDGIGIDLGVKDLAICSSGRVYKNINKTSRVRRLKKKQRKLQRKISRKYERNKKGASYQKTRNIIKSEKQLLRLTHRLTDIRTNYIQQVTAEIVKREPSFIVMEDLNVSGMMKNRHLARAVQEQKLAEFYRIMQYKCDWNGITLITANRFYASSKTCSVCGNIKKDLKLSDRTYHCEHCGAVINRDFNASVNLYKYGKSVINQ
ncbi:MAG: transposase [Synergistaceae bacterium]|nr:transposase [Synergistaceae bacterium]